MKIAYFDCFSGISGNMIIGALIDAGMDFKAFKDQLKKLRIEDYGLVLKKVRKNGISTTYFDVEEKAGGKEKSLRDIVSIIDKSSLSESVKIKSKEIFSRLAEAESKVHGIPVNKIHFHEVGAIDSIIDIVGSAVAVELLGISEIYSSPLPISHGSIESQHGILPVPAPATLELMKGIPVYKMNVNGENVTPTGTAIISSIADGFGDFPEMKISRIGYGAGKYDFAIPNALRVFIGQKNAKAEDESLLVVETNIDDMNPQIYDYVFERLFQAGALDVYITNILMKKNRPAIKLSVLTGERCFPEIRNILFTETTTLGIRINRIKRTSLERKKRIIATKYGKINVKFASFDGKIVNISPEYDDLRKAAAKFKIPLKEIFKEVENKIK